MSDFLEQVVAERRADAAIARSRGGALPAPSNGPGVGLDDPFTAALRHRKHGRISVIAEVKRVSPALGRLAAGDFDLAGQARRYAEGGATAISVLTEPRHWGGSLDDVARVRAAVGAMPILCKDVVVDEHQLAQAKEAGADAVLLIAEALTDDELRWLSARAHAIGLGVLLEAHEHAAFDRAVASGEVVVGVNARDLRHPSVIDPRRIHELHTLAGPAQVLVAESGLASADDVRGLPRRVDAVLVGTALMRASDPGALIREIAAIERVAA